jgi:hypothetical protein
MTALRSDRWRASRYVLSHHHAALLAVLYLTAWPVQLSADAENKGGLRGVVWYNGDRIEGVKVTCTNIITHDAASSTTIHGGTFVIDKIDTGRVEVHAEILLTHRLQRTITVLVHSYGFRELLEPPPNARLTLAATLRPYAPLTEVVIILEEQRVIAPTLIWQTTYAVSRMPALFSSPQLPQSLPRQMPLPTVPAVGYSKVDYGSFELNTLPVSRDAVFSSPFAEWLPLPGWRSPDSLALLAPGVAPPPLPVGALIPAVAPGLGTAGQFSVNGLRGRDNNFTIDGSDNNDEDTGVRRQGLIAEFPQPVESLTEFRVITTFPDASYGRGIAGKIDALSQSGGYSHHGQFWGFATGGPLDALNYFDVNANAYPSAYRQQIPITYNGLLGGTGVAFDNVGSTMRTPFSIINGTGYQFNPTAQGDRFFRSQEGFAVSGPLHKRPLNGPPHKTETTYSLSYERRTLREREETNFAVPAANDRQICALAGSSCIPGSLPGLFPSSLRGDALWSLYPFPNNPLGPYGRNTFTESLPGDGNANVYMGELDRHFGNERTRHSIAIRYNGSDETSIIQSVGDAIFSSLKPILSTQNAAVFFNSTFTPRLSNTFRMSYGQTHAHFDEVRDPYLSPSSNSPGTPFLLNAPLLLNITQPSASSAAVKPMYAVADSFTGQNLLNANDTNLRSFYVGVPAGTTPVWADQIDNAALGELSVGGFSSLGVDVYHFPQQRENDTWQWADTATQFHGRHTLHAGVDLRRIALNNIVERNTRTAADYYGLFDADGVSCSPVGCSASEPAGSAIKNPIGYTPLSSTSMVSAGLAAAAFQSYAIVYGDAAPNYSLNLRATQAEFFLQDEFAARSNLRLLVGVRFNDARVPQDISGHFQQAFNGRSILESAEQECPAASDCAPLVNVLSALLPSSLQSALNPQPFSFDGRLGLAWSPGDDGRTTVRLGSGRYTGQFPAVLVDEARNVFPSFVNVSGAVNTKRATKVIDGSDVVVQNGVISLSDNQTPIDALLALSQTFPTNPLSANLVYPASPLRSPYAIQQHCTVEHRFGQDLLISLAYVGTEGRHLLALSTPDGGPGRSYVNYAIGSVSGQFPMPFGASYFAQQPFGAVGDLPGWTISSLLYGSSASSSYNSFQATLDLPLRRGIQMNSAFTWSHAIDNASDFATLGGAFALPQDSFRSSQRGSSNFDVRFRSVSEFLVDSSAYLHSNLLRGWRMSGIITLQSAQPYTINTSLDVNMDGNATDRLANTLYLIPGTNPRTKLQLSLPANASEALLLASPGADGTIGRNTFRGWGLYNADVSFGRQFALSHWLGMIVRMEVFNIFNHPNFGIPERILESPAFGEAVESVVPPRTIQIAVKLVF